MAMRAGKFDKRVTLLQKTFTRDPSSGERVEVWRSLGDVWAEKIEGRVLERYVSAQKLAEAEVAFKMRWAPALLTLTAADHRIRYKAQEFDLLGVQEIGRNEACMAFGVAPANRVTGQGAPSIGPV